MTTIQDAIRKEQHYNAPITRVWDAISNAEEISKWFIQADFKAEKGYQYTFTHESTTIVGEVLEVNPVNLLCYTWEIQGTGVATTVKWLLEEKDGGTLLRIEHTGISNYPNEEMAVNMFKDYSGGWDNCASELEKYLNAEANGG